MEVKYISISSYKESKKFSVLKFHFYNDLRDSFIEIKMITSYALNLKSLLILIKMKITIWPIIYLSFQNRICICSQSFICLSWRIR